jgi:hypothetical protein
MRWSRWRRFLCADGRRGRPASNLAWMDPTERARARNEARDAIARVTDAAVDVRVIDVGGELLVIARCDDRAARAAALPILRAHFAGAVDAFGLLIDS